MLKWVDIIKVAKNGNPEPDRTVKKSDSEWRAVLSPEQYHITRERGTERPFSSDMCSLFEPGLYACVCCDTLLFDASEKFESGTGWPSFTQPVKENAIAYHMDRTFGMVRIETTCNTCGAHLGHVFQDGPPPSGLRYCMNAAALKKISSGYETATFGGGCFWCTEAVFQQLRGVQRVESGYSGGSRENPSYEQVCTGATGHAEVVQVTFDPEEISYADLLRIHLSTHDPTTLNRQGGDHGTQYRSIILVHDPGQEKTAREIIAEMQPDFDDEIVTQIEPFRVFYKAEDYHQNYFNNNPAQPYCAAVINPKLTKFRKLFKEKLRAVSSKQ
jgi:peptide methionine sulfoxide reductase msrA/msrB